ncbi:MAG TPA: metallophosphoesterase [Mycobacteriales bacterium]|nr:metallophosphoesterase [Mycobacteriales bacterium]
MVRVLAVADEVVPSLWSERVRTYRPDLVVSCGDLPFDYLEYLVSTLNVPLVFVPGNHDPALPRLRRSRGGLLLQAGLPVPEVGPGGCDNADRQVLDVGGLRIAGLGGCRRYRDGPHQYTEREFRARARTVTRRARRLRRRDGHGVDLLLTHAPPAGVGDRDDAPHRGFAGLHGVVQRVQPRFLLHGHIHPYGESQPDRVLGATRVSNVVGYRVIEVPEPPAG